MPNSSHQKTFQFLLHHHRRKTLHHLQSLHAFAIVSGLFSLLPSPTLTSLLFAVPLLSPFPPNPSYPLSLFHSLPSPSTFHFNLILRTLTLLSSPLPALRFFSQLRRLSLPPDSHTFPFALKACSLLPPSSLPLARSLHSQALKFGFLADLFVHNSILSVYSSLHSLPDALHLFLTNPINDTVSYNTLIDGHVKAGSVAVARRLFDEMPERDVISWGTLLAGYANNNRPDEAITLFDQMFGSGFCPDDVALVSALSACAQLGALDRGRAIHEYIVRNRDELSVYLWTGLVDMYAKCGCIGFAMEVFKASSSRNLFTWNAIVVGLAMHGHGKLALEYFEKMRTEGVRPDGVTFLGVLVGCSHAGLIGAARKVFDEMERIYGVKRELKHYGCMADLLGRAGLIDDAVEMIEGMPMEGDAYVWGGLLAGCRIHGNVKVAEIAAKHLLELNPGDSGIYSIMAEMYAAAKRWEDVARMRKMMNDRKVNKNVGCSSIEVDEVGYGSIMLR